MKLKLISLTTALFVPLMSCRTTDANLQTVDNAARTSDAALSQNVCGADMPTDKAEQELRQKHYDLWFGKVGNTSPLIVIGNNNKQVLTEEVQHTLNAIPMNLLIAFFYSGGKLVVNEAAEEVCAGKIQEYRPEKRVFAFEDSAPLEAKTTDANGFIADPANGPQTELPKIRSCWVSVQGQSGVEIHVNDDVVSSEKSLRPDGKLAASVRHGTVRMFAFMLSELIAHTYIEQENRSLDGALQNGDKTFDTKIDLKNNNKVAGFDPTVESLKFGPIEDPENPGKKVAGIQIPVNKEFMTLLAGNDKDQPGMFSLLSQDAQDSEGRYNLSHYQRWMNDRGLAKENFESVLNHFAFADAFDSYYCNEATRDLMAKEFERTSRNFTDVARALEAVAVDEQSGSIETHSAYLLAGIGGWQGDLYYGVFGENLRLQDSRRNGHVGPEISFLFRFFRNVFGGFMRAVSWVWNRVIQPVARFVGQTIRYGAQAVLHTAGAVAGTVASAVAPRWANYRSHVGRGAGPFARGFRNAGRFWTWRGAYYRGNW